MKPRDLLEQMKKIDEGLVQLYQEVFTLQEELREAHRFIRGLAKSKKPKEDAREYVAELVKQSKA